MTHPDQNPRESGIALVLALVLTIGLIGFTALSVEVTRAHATVRNSETTMFRSRLVAESGLAEALARLKEAGQTSPVSGHSTSAEWVSFSNGDYYYSTDSDAVNQTSTITVWGRVPDSTSITNTVSASVVSPDDANWDGTGYTTHGIEVSVLSSRYLPESPAYFGNGGVEKPLGGFNWGNSVDVFDPSTWVKVTSNPSSYQAAGGALEINSLDHPFDFLYNGGTPTPVAGVGYHDYSPWTSQTDIGQMNIQAWFDNSAAGGSAWGMLTPPTANYSSDPNSDQYVLPVDSSVADVQDYAWSLWSTYATNPSATLLSQGYRQGTYGDLTTPSITFVTGHLKVQAGQTFKGAGILVIRDDFDPNYDTNNTPSTSAALTVSGTLEWTGLVIVAGWRPSVNVANGGSMTIVGALMGEDSVMSGGEESLDSATIILTARDDMKLLYSASLFKPGSFIYDLLPLVRREVVGAREVYAD